MSVNTFISSQLSPSVRMVENDYSQYSNAPVYNKTCLVGFTTFGPINTPVKVSNLGDFVKVFGLPHRGVDVDKYNYIYHAAASYLSVGGDLNILRAFDEAIDIPAATASIDTYTAENGTTEAGEVTFNAKYRGTYGETINLVIKNSKDTSATAFEDFDILVYTKSITGSYTLVENFKSLNLKTDNVRNAAVYINGYSEYIEVDISSTANTFVKATGDTKIPLAISKGYTGVRKDIDDGASTPTVVFRATPTKTYSTNDITLKINISYPSVPGEGETGGLTAEDVSNSFIMKIYEGTTLKETKNCCYKLDTLTSTLAGEGYKIFSEITSEYFTFQSVSKAHLPKEADTLFAINVQRDAKLTDGISSTDDNSAIIDALDYVSDSEMVDVNIIGCPGFSDNTLVIGAMNDTCEARGNSMFIADIGKDKSVTEAISDFMDIEASRGALYYGWINIRSVFDGLTVLTPPSVSILSAYASSDAIAGHSFFAPAGNTRGVLTNAISLESRPKLEERDKMYGYGNYINPIVQLPGELPTIYGQKTMTKRQTSLNRVNVRRTLDYLQTEIKKISRNFLFEANDESTRYLYSSAIKNVLSEVVMSRGMNDFRVICDKTINTSETIDRNELRVRIGIQPMKSVEFIFIEYGIYNTGEFNTVYLGETTNKEK